MTLLYIILGVVIAVPIIAGAVWLGMLPSLRNRKSRMPEAIDRPNSSYDWTNSPTGGGLD